MTSTSPGTLRIGQYAVNLGLRAVLGFARLFPYRYRVPLMGWLTSRIIAPLAGYDRRIRENLHLVCPEMAEDRINQLVRSMPSNSGRTLMEIYSGQEFIERARAAPVHGEGQQDLKEATERGRPVILVGAHFGNYEAVRAKLATMGYNVGALYRPLRNPFFNAHYVHAMRAIGEPLFEQNRHGIANMIRHLRNGGILGVLVDINSVDGVYMDFFQTPARTTLSMAKLALKLDAVMIPFFGRRVENGLDFEIILPPAIPHSDPVTMMQAFNQDLEARVRKDMDQWFWVHRRWKT